MLDWYEPEVQELEGRVAHGQIPKDPVVFYGSSSVRLWGTLAEDMGDTRVLNFGFGGSTLEACAYFFERLVTPVNPCSLVVYAGDNDLGDGRSPQEVLGFFQALAAKVERDLPGKEFALISIKPSPARLQILERIKTANRLIREDMAARGNGYFIDVFDAMLEADGQPQAGLYTEDGLHMSPAGYQLWTRLLGSYRDKILPANISS